MGSDFKAERFGGVRLLADDGYTSERVTVEVGLDGLVLQSVDNGRTLRKFPLNHIARWAARGSSLVLYTKTPADVEERTVQLQADEGVIRSMLDTLTCCCMQMCELINSSERPAAAAPGGTSNPFTALLNQSKKKLPTADEVEFWKQPEKAGWMLSQGEHIKTWRRRWFVLKQGYLYRFASSDVTSSSKPRGVVDLSKVADVKDGRADTGRPNSLKLATSSGRVCYVTDSETELVEWMSALEGAVNRIVKQVAGVEDEAPAPLPRLPSSEPGRGTSSSSGRGDDWGRQPERKAGPATVTVVGFGGGGGVSASAPPASNSNTTYNDFNYAGLNYSSIAGVAGTAGSSANGGEPLVSVDYTYPVPSFTRHPSSSDHQAVGNNGGYSGYMEQLSGSAHMGYGQPEVQVQAPVPSWQVHYTPEGRAYYHNASTGATTWEAPAGMA